MHKRGLYCTYREGLEKSHVYNNYPLTRDLTIVVASNL